MSHQSRKKHGKILVVYFIKPKFCTRLTCIDNYVHKICSYLDHDEQNVQKIKLLQWSLLKSSV